ncbi:MAG: hypothetical protein U5L02_05265 [Rheinheimera sp.]|nr:hypothetical protein [Rheinheimera sp.]
MDDSPKSSAAQPREHPTIYWQLSRYPGATLHYGGERSRIFFGEAGHQTTYRSSGRPLVVLYGKSGLGKSSLLNAGIIRRQQTGRSFSLWLSASAPAGRTSDSPLSVAKTAVARLWGGLTSSMTRCPMIRPQAYFRQTRQLNGGGQPMLIFDQFEELFSYPQEAILEFQSELELLNTGIPLRFLLLGRDSPVGLTDGRRGGSQSLLDTRAHRAGYPLLIGSTARIA